jgi:LysR family transcriptional regulator, carnitine catabolism transcriptional activator
MNVSITNLRVFAVVADAGSIVEAARVLKRTPSAVSMSLKQLEAEIGAPLFEGERKSHLTPVGRFARARARDLLNHYERALATIEAYSRNAIGRVEIACVPSVAVTLLPGVISAFRERWPGVEIDVRDADSLSVNESVERGVVEIGVASPRRSHAGLAWAPLFREPLGVVCRRDDPLRGHSLPLPWSVLEDRLVLANGIVRVIDDPGLREAIERSPIIVYNVLSLIALVSQGVGVTVLPRLSISHAVGDVDFLPLADPRATRRVGVLTRVGETPSPAAAAFIELLRERITAPAAGHGIEVAGPSDALSDA